MPDARIRWSGPRPIFPVVATSLEVYQEIPARGILVGQLCATLHRRHEESLEKPRDHSDGVRSHQRAQGGSAIGS